MKEPLAYFTAAFALLDQAVMMVDDARLLLDVNPAAERLLGRTAQALRGTCLDDLVHGGGGTHDDPRRLLRATVKEHQAARAVIARRAPVHGPSGERLGEVVTLEPHLADQAASWQRLVSESSHLSAILGFDGRFRQVSARWTDVLGYTAEELLSMPLGMLIHADDLERTMQAGGALIGQPDADLVAFENRYLCKGGGYRWLSWYAIAHAATGNIYAIATDITELKRQERLLNETQAAAQVGGWEIDMATGSLYWTSETYRLHETSPEEYTPTVETAIQYYTEDSRPIISEVVTRAIQDAEPFDLELELISARGKRLWCRAIGSPAVEHGEVTRIYGSFQDITEQRRMQHALRASEARFRSIVRDVGMGLVVHGPGAEILHCNQAALDALGLTEDQMLGKTSFDPDWNVVHEDGSPFPGPEHPSVRALSTGQSVMGVVMGVYRPRTQDRVWLVVHAVVQRDGEGDVAAVVVSFSDITDRKRAEDAARESDAMFRAVYDNAGLGVLLRDQAGRLVECNRTFERMLGRSAEALQFMADTAYMHPDDRDAPAALHAALLAGERESYELDRRYLRSDGSTLWGRVTVSLVRDAEGAPRHIVEMVTDTTDRKQMEAQLLLADRLTSLGTMAAGVAHEINNPLTWLMGNVSFALDLMDELHPGMPLDADTLEELRSVLTESLSGAERVRTIVRDLKLFSRSEDTPGARADLARVIHSTTRMLNNELSHRANLVLDLIDVPPVSGDEARLGQVLTNLLVNAMQALPERNQDENELRVRLRYARDRVVLEVIDNGVGIAPEVQSRIFDPFFSTKDVGEGTGLGLSICHSIVTGLGGCMEVDSRPGVGTTFRMLLRPAVRPEAAAVPHVPPKAGLAARKRVLCIDDEPDVGRLVMRILRKQHEVIVETDGTVALERIRAGERYDAILCDLMMPSISGMDFYHELCASVPEMAERCGFMTGGVFTAAARAFAAELPPSRLIEKPFHGEAVQALVGHLLS